MANLRYDEQPALSSALVDSDIACVSRAPFGAAAPFQKFELSDLKTYIGADYKYVNTGVNFAPTAANIHTVYTVSGGGVTATLPAVNTLPAGWDIIVKNSAGTSISITGPANSIDGQTTITLEPNASVQVIADGTAAYFVTGQVNSTTSRLHSISVGADKIFLDPTSTFSKAVTGGALYIGVTQLGFGVTEIGWANVMMPPNLDITQPVTLQIRAMAPSIISTFFFAYQINYGFWTAGDVVTGTPNNGTVQKATVLGEAGRLQAFPALTLSNPKADSLLTLHVFNPAVSPSDTSPQRFYGFDIIYSTVD